MIIPRYYQIEAKKALYDYWRDTPQGAAIISSSTGTGKSVCIADITKDVIQKRDNTRVIILSHVAEILSQNANKLYSLWEDAPIGVYSASLKKKQIGSRIVIAGIQSVHKKANVMGWFDLVIVDECFTGETLVMTNHGEKRIDKVKCGDIVYTATGFAEVVVKSTKKADILYKVTLSNGSEIKCTANHPFLSEKGWTCANALERGSKVFSIQNMPELWDTLSSDNNGKICTVQNGIWKKSFLLNILFKEARECNVASWNKGKSIRDIKKDWAQAVFSWWKRTNHSTSKNGNGDVGGALGNGNSYSYESTENAKDISNMLQSRSGASDRKKSDRIGREYSLWEKRGIRSEKGQFPCDVRVESVEIEERRGSPLVYNLQTNGHPSYFANGILVHNCHLLSEKDQGMYRNFIKDLRKINPKLRLLGLSATPWRMKGGLLTEGEMPLFDEIVYTYTMKQAIDDGYLSPIISKHSLVQADLSSVHTVMGDFHQGEMEGQFRNEYLVQMAVNEIIQLGHDRKAWLLFSSGIDHAYDLRDALLDKNIEAVTITGETDTLQREGILRMFSNGEKYRAITNYGVLTTGTDIPRIDLVATLFGTKSSAKLLQCVGRGLRLSPETSKDSCLFLDYGSNLERFGCCLDELGVPSQMKKREGQTMPMKTCPECRSVHPISMLECKDCGYVFPIDTTYKHEEKATNAPAMSSERANGEWYDVDNVSYAKHPGRIITHEDGTKETKPDTLKVTYLSGSRIFREWICVNHDGFAKKKAIAWLDRRILFKDDLPIERRFQFIHAFAIEDAVNNSQVLLIPYKIRVRKNGKYEEIVEYDFIPSQS